MDAWLRIGWSIRAHLDGAELIDDLDIETVGRTVAAQLLEKRIAPKPAVPVQGLPQKRLRKVLEYIRGNMTRDLSIAELAQVAKMGESQFKMRFLRSVGVPAHKYVINCRVTYAANLLQQTMIPISQVALYAGFSDQSHLARCMRRISGTTPRELRAQSL